MHLATSSLLYPDNITLQPGCGTGGRPVGGATNSITVRQPLLPSFLSLSSLTFFSTITGILFDGHYLICGVYRPDADDARLGKRWNGMVYVCFVSKYGEILIAMKEARHESEVLYLLFFSLSFFATGAMLAVVTNMIFDRIPTQDNIHDRCYLQIESCRSMAAVSPDTPAKPQTRELKSSPEPWRQVQMPVFGNHQLRRKPFMLINGIGRGLDTTRV
ncbi:hypothetical protein P167DRAFT_175486 [Morchella conica CCBAS932]|uniref:Uncharacterized protein n=1 Tax=Morchella conica CCBAS932 TaxID=1392247 RepID=A0A3N4KRZ8_9PEZI|nr:hypothetical protein P167DRAFT_175486 [Morchella conica CCBAS932]